MDGEFGSTLERLFSQGVTAWADIEVAKNYSANDPRPATRDANGNVVPQGTNGGVGLLNVVQGPLVTSLAIAVVAGLVVWLVVRKL